MTTLSKTTRFCKGWSKIWQTNTGARTGRQSVRHSIGLHHATSGCTNIGRGRRNKKEGGRGRGRGRGRERPIGSKQTHIQITTFLKVNQPNPDQPPITSRIESPSNTRQPSSKMAKKTNQSKQCSCFDLNIRANCNVKHNNLFH